MVGVITNWDILAHPVVTIRGFGWRVFFRAVFAGPETTFLSLLHGVHSSAANVPPLLERCIVQIETSEINQVFDAALAASDAAFVKRLKPFQEAMKIHMTYIIDRLPELAPQLMMASRELRAKFPRVR